MKTAIQYKVGDLVTIKKGRNKGVQTSIRHVGNHGQYPGPGYVTLDANGVNISVNSIKPTPSI